jgi:(2Fe-2S) ferredoxin
MTKLSKEKLDSLKKASSKKKKQWIKVGMSTCGIAAGADKTFKILKDEVKKRDLDISVEQCGCAGMCFAEPLVEIRVEGMPKVTYGRVNEEAAHAIIDKHVCQRRLLNDHIYNAEVD